MNFYDEFLCDLPMSYKEGSYGIGNFQEELDIEDVVSFEYGDYGNTLTCYPPDNKTFTLWGISKEELEESFTVFYDRTNRLKKITANVKDKEALLYIRYDDIEDAKQKIHDFAIKNADMIIDQICQCTDLVARLFVEYFSDGDCRDYHAVIGTAAQKEELEKKYPKSSDTYDWAGNFPSENIKGDNDTFVVMLSCAYDMDVNFFLYAVDIMSERIREKAIAQLNKTPDFKFLCQEYD